MADELKTSRPNALTWNAGGWFGVQIGSTCWIAVCAAMLGPHDMTIAGFVLALFLAANVVGFQIWRNRSRISPYTGIQALVIVTGAASLIAVAVIDRAGMWQMVEGVGGKVEAWQMYALIPAMVVGLLGLFWSLNRSHARGSSLD